MLIFLTFPLWSIPVMLIWYAIGIQAERTSLPILVKLVLDVVAYTGLLFDIFLQYTVANLWFLELAPIEEYTISDRIRRLIENTGWRGVIARHMACILNRLAPNGKHI